MIKDVQLNVGSWLRSCQAEPEKKSALQQLALLNWSEEANPSWRPDLTRFVAV